MDMANTHNFKRSFLLFSFLFHSLQEHQRKGIKDENKQNKNVIDKSTCGLPIKTSRKNI